MRSLLFQYESDNLILTDIFFLAIRKILPIIEVAKPFPSLSYPLRFILLAIKLTDVKLNKWKVADWEVHTCSFNFILMKCPWLDRISESLVTSAGLVQC